MTGASRARVGAAMVALALASGTAACVRTDAIHYYTLADAASTPAPAPARIAATARPRYTVAVAPATLPEALDRPELVLRLSATELAIDDDRRWAEPLQSGIARAVARGLTSELDGATAALGDGDGDADGARKPDVEVTIDVQRFDATLRAGASVDALWTARWPDGGATRSGRSRTSAPTARAGDYDALVTACAQALAAMTREIAGAIRAEIAAR